MDLILLFFVASIMITVQMIIGGLWPFNPGGPLARNRKA